MFLSPEVIIVSEFPRDSLEERQPPANTLFSTYFDTVDVFSLSRALSHSHDFRIVVETTRNSVFVQCLIRGELKFESNYFFHCAIKYSKIRRLRFYDRVECAKFFGFVRKRDGNAAGRNLRTKAQLYEIPRLSSVAWFCSPPSHHISRFLREFRHFGVYEVLRSCPMSPLRDLSKQSPSPLARCNVLPKRSYFSLLLNYVPKLCFGFETLAGSLGWNHVQSSERTLFLFDEVKVFARRRYICSNSSGITRIIAYRSIVSTREYTSVGRGNWRIER